MIYMKGKWYSHAIDILDRHSEANGRLNILNLCKKALVTHQSDINTISALEIL